MNKTQSYLPSVAYQRMVVFLMLLLFGTLTAQAADKQQRFGVKGAGAARCGAFVDAYDNKKPELLHYGGWIDGFITGINHQQDGLFDLAPWQSSEVVAFALADFCRKNEQLAFFQAMLLLKQNLQQSSLKEFSQITVAQQGKHAVAIYEIVLKQIREKLISLGHLDSLPDSNGFDEATSVALIKFQNTNDLEPTGLPDQVTVSRLMK